MMHPGGSYMALVREAVEELARRKLRTALTLLGMVFGVGAIVAMLAVGEGSRREALKLVEQLGLHNVILQAKPAASEDEMRDRRARSLGLTSADARAALSVVPDAQSVSVSKAIKVSEMRGPLAAAKAQAFAVSMDYADHASLQVEMGRWFNQEDAETLAPVCVIGARLARQLFGKLDVVGGKIKLNHVWLEVIGVLKARDLGRDQFEGVSLGVDDERLYMPWESASERLKFEPIEDELDQITVKLSPTAEPSASAKVLEQLIRQRHNGVEDSTLVVPAGLYRQNQQTQRIFTLVMSSVAAVSLLVGGIGIMNIMLANILERRREIGLKRALGARRKDLIQQFLAEALVIAVLGALAGLLFGALLAYSIASFAAWQVAWSPLWLGLAVLMCLVVGVGFGVYPARKAAELDPISALRTD